MLVSPGAGGAHNWNPMAYSPLTKLVYLPVTETYMAYAAADELRSRQASGPGHRASPATTPSARRSTEYADAHTKRLALGVEPGDAEGSLARRPIRSKGSGGVLATAGNLVFQGTISATLAAYRADNGKKVWEMPVQNVPVAAPITYMVDGEQYVAVNAGWGGGLAHVERSNYTKLFLGKPRLLVFKIGGKAKLPPLPPASRIVPGIAGAAQALTGSPEPDRARASSSTAPIACCATASRRAAASRICAI